jgi:hypothetical protein
VQLFCLQIFIEINACTVMNSENISKQYEVFFKLKSYKGMVRFVRSKPHLKFCVSSNDCTQNFSCRYVVQGCEKIARSWDIQFKFAPPCMCVTEVHLAVALYFLVHSNGVSGARR